jgi:glutathione S-transferase
MSLALYYAPFTCALVPLVLLNEAGASFDVNPIDFRKGDNRTPEYLRLNPRGRVPVLMVDGEPLLENVAIQLWIARAFPEARLLPKEPMRELQAISFMAWCASGIHPSLTPNLLPQRYCDLPGSEESVRRCAQKLLLENYAIANDKLAGHDWFFDDFGCPDAYFFWCFRRGQQFGVDVSRFGHCVRHFERMQERPAVQKALALEASILGRPA